VAGLAELSEPWRETFALMWEAYVAGTVPVGAVVADETGAIVARGRNRILDEPAGAELGRTRLAHAELNALLALEPDRSYTGYTLYTALEPCHLCLSAAFTVRIGTVRYASPDPWGGAAGRLMPSADHLAHPIEVEGPLAGDAGRLPEALLVAHFLWRMPDGPAAAFYHERRPDLVAVATRLPAPDSGAALPDALAALAAM
jgi:tRNA(adenine34) deaminase